MILEAPATLAPSAKQAPQLPSQKWDDMENGFSVDGKSGVLIVNHDSPVAVASQMVAHFALFL